MTEENLSRIESLLGGLSTEVSALLSLHGAQNLTQFWRSAYRVVDSAFPRCFHWFDSRPALLPSAHKFARGRSFTNAGEFRRFCDSHPLKSILVSNPSKTVALLSSEMPEAVLRKSGFYQEFMAPSQDVHAVMLGIGSGKLQSFVGLHRREGECNFSCAEMRLLRELQHQMTTTLKRVYSLEMERRQSLALGSLFSKLFMAIIVLDWELELLHCSPAATETAAIWATGDERARFLKKVGQFSLPPDIVRGCLSVKARCVASKGKARERVVDELILRHTGLPNMRASVRLLYLDTAASGNPVFVVTFDQGPHHASGPREGGHPDCLLQTACLTQREREVALLACAGSSDKEIAAHLGKSVLTVKKQLGATYQKLHVDGRAKLPALLRP